MANLSDTTGGTLKEASATWTVASSKLGHGDESLWDVRRDGESE
jgi:hypothetical protein